jgi:hypothetical protein
MTIWVMYDHVVPNAFSGDLTVVIGGGQVCLERELGHLPPHSKGCSAGERQIGYCCAPHALSALGVPESRD